MTATTVKAWPNGLPIPYTAPAASASVTVTATAHTDSTISTTATIAVTGGSAGPALNGAVQAGTQPVAGASVALYAAGTSGYASASTLVYAPGGSPFVYTDSNGNFTIPSGYTCAQPGSQVYLCWARRPGGNEWA